MNIYRRRHRSRVCYPSAENEIIDPVANANISRRQTGILRARMSEISSSAGFCACHYRQSDCKQTLIFTFVPIRRKGRRDLDCFFGFCFFLSSTLFHISRRYYSTIPQLSTQKTLRARNSWTKYVEKKTSATARTGCRLAIKFIAT